MTNFMTFFIVILVPLALFIITKLRCFIMYLLKLTRKLLPKNIVNAHDEGVIHFHDSDYFIQHEHNCCLVNLEDMLLNCIFRVEGRVLSQIAYATFFVDYYTAFIAGNITGENS